jgi:hypothetical protein
MVRAIPLKLLYPGAFFTRVGFVGRRGLTIPLFEANDLCSTREYLADWRRTRFWCLEMAILTHAIRAQERLADPVADQENAVIPAMHTALAFSTLTNQSAILQNLSRYEVRFSREYNRALKLFKEHRAERLKQHVSSKQTDLTPEKY